MEDLATETSTRSNSAYEAGKIMGIPEQPICSLLHRVLNVYPHKIQAFHKLLPADTDTIQNSAT